VGDLERLRLGCRCYLQFSQDNPEAVSQLESRALVEDAEFLGSLTSIRFQG
jgi:hypothetical protein